MSKGTKQIRLGRLERLLQELATREEAIKEFAYSDDSEIKAYAKGMAYVIDRLKKEFDL